MTNAVCESYNKSWVDFGYCRLRAVSRTKVFLNINATILHPVNDVFVKGQLMKKANGYKPWLYSATFDGCQFIRRRNNPLIRLIWELFKEYSTINHTCPYEVRRVNSLKYYYFYPIYRACKWWRISTCSMKSFPLPFQLENMRCS